MPAPQFVLWGSHPHYAGGVPIKLTAGNLGHCRSEQRYRTRDAAWLLGIYGEGTEPAGLRLMAAAR